MNYPVHEFKEKWYNAQGFGVKTSYGFHDGNDLNLKTGGDSDLGQELLAIASGEITSVHSHTSVPSFGKHLHLKIETLFGVRWVHYAHCQDILVSEGIKVAEGQLIAHVGKSGTTIAHLHFAIKNQPTGIDGIAKTQEDLLKWENPIEFIDKCILKGTEVNNEQELKDKISDMEIKVGTLNEAMAGKSLEVNNLRTELETQERDNADLGKQLQEARSQREEFRAEKENIENQFKKLTQEKEELEKRYETTFNEKKDLEEAVKTQSVVKLSGVSRGLLIQELIYRLFKR